MSNISSVRLTVPKAAEGEIVRKELIDFVLSSHKKFAYIHAGAGYGKTTLLSQIANSAGNTVWISFAGESDILAFVNIICEAVRQPFPDYDFTASEYIPFIGNNDFIAIIANALISSIEVLPENFIMIFDDIHTIVENQIKEFVACFMRYSPKNIRLFLAVVKLHGRS